MHQAKQKHIGFVKSTPALDQCNTRDLTLMGELRHAIIKNELAAYYQPKVNIKTDNNFILLITVLLND